ncbi:acetyltransferase [bacterium]|nr:acetyltransferase [bacterium]
MTNKIIIAGIGETANLAYEYFTYDSDYEVVAFCVNKEYLKEKEFCSLPVVELENLKDVYSPQDYKAFVAISSTKLNRARTKVYNEVKKQGFECVNYISSKADVWHNAKLGENCCIMSGCTVQPFASIGNNVTLWYNSNIGHRSVVKDNCFIATADIAGFTTIEENCFIGARSVIADYTTVAKDNYIAMGSIVNKRTKENSIYKGNPAKRHEISAKEYCQVEE